MGLTYKNVIITGLFFKKKVNYLCLQLQKMLRYYKKMRFSYVVVNFYLKYYNNICVCLRRRKDRIFTFPYFSLTRFSFGLTECGVLESSTPPKCIPSLIVSWCNIYKKIMFKTKWSMIWIILWSAFMVCPSRNERQGD